MRLDWLTLALLGAGVVLLAGSLMAVLVVMSQPAAPPGGVPPEATSVPTLAADRVSTVLYMDATAGAGAAARPGDRIDVFGYFPSQVTGGPSVTRVLLSDVPVLNAEHTGASVALTLAVPQQSALLLQEAQALGARPFVDVRAAQAAPGSGGLPTSFSDADLAARVAGGVHGSAPSHGD